MVRILTLLFLMCSALSASAQQAANLIADRIEISPDGVLQASGAVTVWHGETRISAREISYTSSGGQLKITGPIRLTDGTGTVILADQAAISQDLSQGIISSARIILSQQVQIATAQISRVSSRYTQAYHASATSCFICKGKIPLWQIRAKRIVHDSVEKQLYFDRAQLRVLDVPVFFFPYLRLPDPTLKRATGFLVPQLSTSTTLGTTIRAPYFFKLGNHRDLTLTPMVSSRATSLGFQYRQAYQTGRLSFKGAISRDTILLDKNRGYIFLNAGFELDQGYMLGVQVQTVSDPSYLFEYNVSEIDRLESNVTLNRTRRYKNSELRFSNYHSLRESETNATQPTLITEGIVQRRIHPGSIGGVLDLETSFLVSYRSSSKDTDGSDADSDVDGYDTARLSFLADWHRDWTSQNGIVLDVDSEIETSQYIVRQNQTFDPNTTRLRATSAIGLQWPLSRRLQDGGLQLIEPRIQLVGLTGQVQDIPNQDSTRVEFDEGNLFRFNRAPGFDQTETGARLNIGVSGSNRYVSSTTIGWQVGRVYRQDNLNKFSSTSGLSGSVSDWLLVGSLETASGIELITRALLKEAGDVNKTEARIKWQNDIQKIAATYVGLSADSLEDRATSLSSLALDWQYNFTPNWRSTSGFQFDSTIGKLSKLGFGLRYANECMNIDFSASRRFSTSTTLKEKTEFGLSVDLTGFSSGVRKAPKSRQCGS